MRPAINVVESTNSVIVHFFHEGFSGLPFPSVGLCMQLSIGTTRISFANCVVSLAECCLCNRACLPRVKPQPTDINADGADVGIFKSRFFSPSLCLNRHNLQGSRCIPKLRLTQCIRRGVYLLALGSELRTLCSHGLILRR